MKRQRHSTAAVALGIFMAVASAERVLGQPAAGSDNTAAPAQEKSILPLPDYGGDFWNRAYLTGERAKVQKIPPQGVSVSDRGFGFLPDRSALLLSHELEDDPGGIPEMD